MHARLLRAALVAASLAWSAWIHAANVTDHWWNPAESGWGLSVTQQDDVAFVALFVYGNDGKPTWLTASATRYATDPSGNPGFSGPLYRTQGPWFGGAFDPAAVQAVPVGTLTFESTGPGTAILVYTVDGVRVNKVVTRLTFRHKDWSGVYRGVNRTSYRDCQGGTTPAVTYDDGLIDVEHAGSAFRMWVEGKKATCTYTGSYQQVGRLGIVSGTYTCADGPSGTFTLRGLETHESAFGGQLEMSHPSCGYVKQEIAGFNLD
ncbi:MAG: hypothetical protein U1F10_02800 [Burkholderiales bacterium]